MELIRCLIADVSQRLLRDIVAKVAEREDDIEFLGCVTDTLCVTDALDVASLIEKYSVDVLVTSVDSHNIQEFSEEVLKNKSHVMVLGIIDDGHSAAIFVQDVGVNEILHLITAYEKR